MHCIGAKPAGPGSRPVREHKVFFHQKIAVVPTKHTTTD